MCLFFIMVDKICIKSTFEQGAFIFKMDCIKCNKFFPSEKLEKKMFSWLQVIRPKTLH